MHSRLQIVRALHQHGSSELRLHTVTKRTRQEVHGHWTRAEHTVTRLEGMTLEDSSLGGGQVGTLPLS